jgi:mannose-1-phosphate guanylyltransferase/phosphomannomutase
MKVFILSAGLGTRLRSLTNDKPKVMVRVGNKPILEHLINLCAHHGFKDIIINLHYLPDVVINYFNDGKRFDVNITYSHEKEKIMGGAGALKQVEELLKKNTFFVLNGDVMTNINLTKMVQFHQKKGGIGSFLVHSTDHPYDSDLVEFNQDCLVKRFFRPKPGDQFKPISKTGTHIFEPEVLKFIPSGQKYSLEKQLIPDLLKCDKKLYAYYSEEYSRDMGTLERLAQVKKDYANSKISF